MIQSESTQVKEPTSQKCDFLSQDDSSQHTRQRNTKIDFTSVHLLRCFEHVGMLYRSCLEHKRLHSAVIPVEVCSVHCRIQRLSPLQFWASSTWASVLGEALWIISLAQSQNPCWHATWRGVFPSWSWSSSETRFSTRPFTTAGWFKYVARCSGVYGQQN